MGGIEGLLRSLIKAIAHLLTGKCEVERICTQGPHTHEISVAFARSLYHSKRLSTYKTLVFQFKKFNTPAAVNNVMEVKKIKRDPLVIANLTHCFDDLGEVNAFVRSLEKQAKTEFNPEDKAHVALLSQFWEAMMPDTRVPSFVGEGSEDWSLVGFQGKKPQSDFRGMGLLGLKQLHFFATHRGQRARDCLKESIVEPRYFPFAATGINITAFLMELVRENRFHVRLLEIAESNYIEKEQSEKEQSEKEPLLHQSQPSSSDDDATWRDSDGRKYGSEEEFHMVYADFYSAFVALWVKRNPSNIMAFPSVFAEFKEGVVRNALFATLG